MQGLVSYDSSDGEEREEGAAVERTATPREETAVQRLSGDDTVGNGVNGTAQPQHDDRHDLPHISAPPGPDEEDPPAGPLMGPQGPPMLPPSSNSGATSAPQSPYSASRSLIRDLTLPPFPNLDIPPSPPGSPPPASTAKFRHFLELKKQGVHFNEKLAKSSALKNPGLLQKLMGFAGIDERGQYATTLPKDVWDPDAFPTWAYKDALAKSQQDIQKRRQEQNAKSTREALEFVPSEESSQAGTPAAAAVGGRGLGKSAAERVMAGLDRETSRSPAVGGAPKGRDMERRGGRLDGYKSRRDRSRSKSRERRRRSRSR